METFIITAKFIRGMESHLSKKEIRLIVIEYLISPKLDPEKYKV